MDKMKTEIDFSEFLAQLGIEDKLNDFLDSKAVKTRILPKYAAVKTSLTEAVNKLPEKYRENATKKVDEKLHAMDEEVFVEIVLGKFSEDVSRSLWTLSKYIDVAATVETLMQEVDKESTLLDRIEEMAGELADALRRNLKVSIVEMCTDECESEEEFQEILHAVFDGDEDAPVVVKVEGLEEVAEGLASLIADCIFGDLPDDDDDEEDGDGHCCCGDGNHECCCDGDCHCKESE